MQPFLHNRPFLESVGPNSSHKALRVRRSTIFPLKIGQKQKKDPHAARSLPSSGVDEFFYDFYKISLFATNLYKFLKDH